MASGWGCQHQIALEGREDWCKLLNHKCEPGCKGCVLYGVALFSVEDTPSNKAFERRKVKKRDDNPLKNR
ncbi:MAG: hypothetical protein GXO02_05075 [Epsilonproteobacteria bacterium]|nr:hypothetical protein [Campylobacterota bacterium]